MGFQGLRFFFIVETVHLKHQPPAQPGDQILAQLELRRRHGAAHQQHARPFADLVVKIEQGDLRIAAQPLHVVHRQRIQLFSPGSDFTVWAAADIKSAQLPLPERIHHGFEQMAAPRAGTSPDINEALLRFGGQHIAQHLNELRVSADNKIIQRGLGWQG